MSSDFITRRWLEKLFFAILTLPLMHGPEITTWHWQRSTIGVCHALLWFFKQVISACSAKVFHTNVPSCTMWFRQITKYGDNSNSIEQDTLPIVFIISRQVILYRTRGGTCCTMVSTPKIRSLPDSSTTRHDDINHLDRWRTTTLSQRHKPTQYHKGWKTCTTHMTAWLSITNQEWTQISKGMRLR
jgi:hypothetical protein